MADIYYSVPISEQATTISFYRDTKDVQIWTSDRMMMTKLDRLCETAPDFYKCTEVGRVKGGEEILDKRYELADKAMLSFRTKKAKPELSEEQRAALSARMREAKAAGRF